MRLLNIIPCLCLRSIPIPLPCALLAAFRRFVQSHRGPGSAPGSVPSLTRVYFHGSTLEKNEIGWPYKTSEYRLPHLLLGALLIYAFATPSKLTIPLALKTGMVGSTKSMAFALRILWITGGLNKLHIQLKI